MVPPKAEPQMHLITAEEVQAHAKKRQQARAPRPQHWRTRPTLTGTRWRRWQGKGGGSLWERFDIDGVPGLSVQEWTQMSRHVQASRQGQKDQKEPSAAAEEAIEKRFSELVWRPGRASRRPRDFR